MHRATILTLLATGLAAPTGAFAIEASIRVEGEKPFYGYTTKQECADNPFAIQECAIAYQAGQCGGPPIFTAPQVIRAIRSAERDGRQIRIIIKLGDDYETESVCN